MTAAILPRGYDGGGVLLDALDNTKTVYPARARNVVSIYKAICHGFKFSGWASLAECAGVEVLYL